MRQDKWRDLYIKLGKENWQLRQDYHRALTIIEKLAKIVKKLETDRQSGVHEEK